MSVSASSDRVMDGMTEACMKGGIEACYSSVSCACALLGALDDLSHGRGLQPDQVFCPDIKQDAVLIMHLK